MAGEKRLHLFWDPELDDGFRQRFERALRDLKVDVADASGVDHDPENPAVVAAMVSARGGMALPARTDIVVLAGPGDFPSGGNAVRLEIQDIADGSKRWLRFVEQLRAKLDRASLALTSDDLAIRVDEETQRADEAERARDLLERERDEIDRKAKRLENDLVKARSETRQRDDELERLREIHRLSAFAMTSVSVHEQETVAQARDHAWRAQLAAQRALEMAAKYPDALVWGKTATYSGYNANGDPSQCGVMSFFGGGGETIASYRGEFHEGRREGHGVGVSLDGIVWSGEWKNNEACGFGILETPDGRRFDGEVAPDASDKDRAPHRVRGWLWEPDGAPARALQTHRPATPALPPPQAAGG